jgi:uncharacterized protein (DUF1501 family)
MTIPAFPHRHAIGITRREFVQVGYSGLLGMGLSSLVNPVAAAGRRRRPKSMILVFLTGAPSHVDMFDPKPDAPAEIRGEFKAIGTKLPGLHICEHLPRLAACADKYAVVRSLAHRESNHLVATHHLLTGYQQPGAFFDKVASRDDWPCYSAALDYLRPRRDGLPTGINLPTFLMEGPLTWPGQYAGFLGPRHDPWQIAQDPNSPKFRVNSLRLPPGMEATHLSDRLSLLDEINAQQRQLTQLSATRSLSEQQRLAFSVLTSGRIAHAFELDREPAAVRDRYGRHSFGQSLLLARRLVQAGVRVVQANMGHVQNWDSHSDIFPRLKNKLLPPLDRAMAALLDDLEASGLLADTLVMMFGEFGRTPKLTTPPGAARSGRDHWAPCFFGLFAGAGVRGGQVIGKSDKVGAYPATTPFTPDDIGATAYHVLDVDPASIVHDRQGRPVQLNRGQVMDALFSGKND